LSYKTFEIDTTAFEVEIPEPVVPKVSIDDKAAFDAWKKSNVIPQKTSRICSHRDQSRSG
jgi:sulfite reductase (ferredoxin)